MAQRSALHGKSFFVWARSAKRPRALSPPSAWIGGSPSRTERRSWFTQTGGGRGWQGYTPTDDYLRLRQWAQSGLQESLWQTDQGAGWSFYLSKEDFHPAFSFECRLARAETFRDGKVRVPHFRALNQPVSHREQTRICAFHLPVTLSSNCGIGNNGNQYNE